MIFIHSILMRVTAHTGVGEPATGATCGSATGVTFFDTGGRDVSFRDIGRSGTGVSFRDDGRDVAQWALTVREGLASLDRAVELRAEHVPPAAEPVGPAADPADLLAVEKAGLLQLGDHLAGLLPAAAELLGELA